MRQDHTKKRYGVIDIGSNSIRMMLFDYNGKAQPFANVKKYLRSTRLGHGVDASGNLAETSVARSIDALVGLKGIADAEGVEEIYAFGTSAMRDAGNASVLTAPVLEKTGIAIDIVDGDTEAKYGFYGVSSCFSGNILIADIGGGSTELICGSSAAGIAWDKSLNIGAVRDTEKFIREDPPRKASIESLEAHVKEQVATLLEAHMLPQDTTLVGIGGTITTCSAMYQHMTVYDESKIHMSTLLADDVADMQNDLAARDLEGRKKIAGLQPRRADIIVAGTSILNAVMHCVDAKQITVCGRDNMEGAAIIHFGL
jgi:exopolyphosphatase/guanosine-5'-triphosphate,3'-diphosphate pyrophosphatase